MDDAGIPVALLSPATFLDIRSEWAMPVPRCRQRYVIWQKEFPSTKECWQALS